MRQQFGSTLFEGKVGVLDLDTEIQMVKEVRAAIGSDAILRLDVNNSWPLNMARKALARLEPFNIANIEDPAQSYFDMAKLRQHSAIPFSSEDYHPYFYNPAVTPDGRYLIFFSERTGLSNIFRIDLRSTVPSAPLIYT